MIHHLVLEMKKLLGSLDNLLTKAAAQVKYDHKLLLQARLAPDMFPLVRQVQAVCDQAKYGASRTSGKEAPAHPDTEETIDELKLRIASVVAYLDTFKPADFDGIADRTVSLPRWEGKSMTATAYLVEHAQPNFFFHLTIAYAILRTHGIEVGKRDFLGTLSYR